MIIKVLKCLRIFGMDVYDIENLEDTDIFLKKLIDKNYSTIVVSDEVASFSQDIIKKYKNKENINIIITSSKKYKL